MNDVELVIEPRLQKLLPELSDDELHQLEQNIIQDGRIRDPIIYWNDERNRHLIIDGMHRFAIGKKHGIPYRCEPMVFDTIEDVELWMLNNALGRRNLMKPEDIRTLRGTLYNRLKREDKGHGNQRSSNGSIAKALAEKTGVSEATVRRDGRHVEALDKLCDPVRRAVTDGRLEVSDDQLKVLAKATPTEQQQVAREVRVGSTIEEALTKVGLQKPKREPPKTVSQQIAEADEPEDDAEESELTTEEKCEDDNKTIESFCRSLTKFFDDNLPDVVWLDSQGRVNSARSSLKAACNTLRQSKSVLCPKCTDGQDSKGECTYCKGYGYLPKIMADSLGAVK